MRLRMLGFSKYIPALFNLKNQETRERFEKEIIPEFERMCKSVKGKWLMGTKDVTLLDIWYGSFWEFIYMADCQMTTKKVVIFPHRGQYPKDI